MAHVTRYWTTVSGAVLTATLVLFGATFAAQQVRSSELYTQSRLIQRIVQQDQLELSDVAGNIDLLFRFAGAVTSAYIDFELIPVNEADTFIAIFESLPPDVALDHFAYHRKDLTIEGRAPDLDSYNAFLTAMQETAHFAQVTGETQATEDDTICFTLECIAQATEPLPVFQPLQG